MVTPNMDRSGEGERVCENKYFHGMVQIFSLPMLCPMSLCPSKHCSATAAVLAGFVGINQSWMCVNTAKSCCFPLARTVTRYYGIVIQTYFPAVLSVVINHLSALCNSN